MGLSPIAVTCYCLARKIENRSCGPGSILGRLGVCIPFNGNLKQEEEESRGQLITAEKISNLTYLNMH